MAAKYKIAITFLVLGILCFLSFGLIGSEVDENNFLREPFALIPIGWLFLFLGFFSFLWTLYKKK
tara:strand:- start:200 stop:394 length:195 start_codon:yes stop_codon:yes gene_type:complete